MSRLPFLHARQMSIRLVNFEDGLTLKRLFAIVIHAEVEC